MPIILFLCVHNAGRSQMALGWLTHLAGEGAVAWSGGSEPASEVNPAAVQAIAEVGIDISSEFPQTVDRRGGKGSRCGDHHGLRRRLPDLPRQGLPRLAGSRPCGGILGSCSTHP